MATQIHGSLVEILGLGILLTGPSGIGKSECVLELVQRGHLLVADDVVRIRQVAEAGQAPYLRGYAPPEIRHYLEIRGIGLLYVPDLYGRESCVEEANVDLICHLEKWREGASYERLGLERPVEMMVGVPIPLVVLPVRPATSTASLVEVAGLDARRRAEGFNAAADLDARLRKAGESS